MVAAETDVMVAAAEGLEAGAEIVRGDGLSDRADIVLLAFDREQRRFADGARIDG